MRCTGHREDERAGEKKYAGGSAREHRRRNAVVSTRVPVLVDPSSFECFTASRILINVAPAPPARRRRGRFWGKAASKSYKITDTQGRVQIAE